VAGHVADVRQHKTTHRTPLDLYQEELPHLLPLPEKPYDTAEVLYRTVNPEGHVSYLQNFYSVSLAAHRRTPTGADHGK